MLNLTPRSYHNSTDPLKQTFAGPLQLGSKHFWMVKLRSRNSAEQPALTLSNIKQKSSQQSSCPLEFIRLCTIFHPAIVWKTLLTLNFSVSLCEELFRFFPPWSINNSKGQPGSERENRDGLLVTQRNVLCGLTERTLAGRWTLFRIKSDLWN